MLVSLIIGTRPEAIKMAPVYFELLKSRMFEPVIIATSQHIEMLNQVLNLFSMKPAYNLKVMTKNQTLSHLTSRMIIGLDQIFSKNNFVFTLVQGDTTSAFVGALVSFYHRIPVGHVEAGLRSFNMMNPFPEEANRVLVDSISNIYFAPTERAKMNLINEGINKLKIRITGNTVVDALKWIVKNKSNEINEFLSKNKLKDRKYIYMTMHRRENWGEPMKNALQGVKKVLQKHRDYILIIPVHLNPVVRKVVFDELSDVKNAILIDPVNYVQSVALIKGCDFVLTDSGGLQEEAPTLGKPCLILRRNTERPEAIEAGTAELIGTESYTVEKKVNEMIENRGKYIKMAKAVNPFGDGMSAARIVKELENYNLKDH